MPEPPQTIEWTTAGQLHDTVHLVGGVGRSSRWNIMSINVLMM